MDEYNSRFFPPEWVDQKSVFLCWPDEDHIKGLSTRRVVEEMIESLTPSVTVQLCCKPELISSAQNRLKEILSPHHLNHLVILSVDYDTTWTRDFGPIFFQQYGKQEKILCFPWKNWGYADTQQPFSIKDANLTLNIAKSLNVHTETAPFASEGGDREFNGEGILITCEDVELQRNHGKSKIELEELFLKEYNVKHVIWMKHALLDDYQTFNCPIPLKLSNGNEENLYTCFGTGGHVDEFVRFVSPTTILLAEVHPSERDTALGKTTHTILEQNLQTLKSARDIQGNPFKIIRIPLPPPLLRQITADDPIYEPICNCVGIDGDNIHTLKVIAAASYCNFLISNGVVLMAKYFKEGRDVLFQETDEQAKNILTQLFPTRKICQIYCEAVNFGGGGMHCISQQQPQVIPNK